MNDKDETAGMIRRWAEAFMHQSIYDYLNYGKSHDLSMSQLGVLFQLAHSGVGRVSDIARNLGITPAAVSQMLDVLVKQGLITRKEASKDRRMKQIELTDNGKEMIQEIMKAKERRFNFLAENMNPGERKLIADGLKILIEKMGHAEQEFNKR